MVNTQLLRRKNSERRKNESGNDLRPLDFIVSTVEAGKMNDVHDCELNLASLLSLSKLKDRA